MTPKTVALLKLLEDSDARVSSSAMSELLTIAASSAEITNILAELQEASSPTLRRRTHQMQAILRMRGSRNSLASRMFTKHSNLLQGLAEIHSIWNDDPQSAYLSDIWSGLVAKTRKRPPVTPRKLAAGMKSLGFAVGEGLLDPDLYCLGAVIEDLVGSDALLASIAKELGRMFGLKSAVAMLNGHFVLLFAVTRAATPHSKKALVGRIISPSEGWTISDVPPKADIKILSTDQVITYVASVLLTNAIYSEEPRYVQILSTCLTGRDSLTNMSNILPYPFGRK